MLRRWLIPLDSSAVATFQGVEAAIFDSEAEEPHIRGGISGTRKRDGLKLSCVEAGVKQRKRKRAILYSLDDAGLGRLRLFAGLEASITQYGATRHRDKIAGRVKVVRAS
jgi:hypothetical protein